MANPGPQSHAVVLLRLPGEEVVPGTLGGEAGRDVARGRQVPGLGVAVAVVAHADRAVGVGDDRHRARVRPGRRRELRSHVTPVGAAGRVGPMQGRVDRQQVGPEVAVGVDEVVDPLDPHRPVALGLDRQRRGVVQQQTPLALGRDRPIPPHRRGRHPRRQNLLGELTHRNLVVVDRLAAPPVDRARPWHHRRDQQRRHVLGHLSRIERAARDRRGGDGDLEQLTADLAHEHQPDPGTPADAQKIPTRHRPLAHRPSLPSTAIAGRRTSARPLVRPKTTALDTVGVYGNLRPVGRPYSPQFAAALVCYAPH